MSRCSIKPNTNHKEVTEVVVGLDRPLQSWFFQVFSGSKPNGDDNIVLNEWCNRSRAVELIEEYGDISDPYTFQVRKAIVSDLCPQQEYGLPPSSSWDTVQMSIEHKDANSFAKWINGILDQMEENDWLGETLNKAERLNKEKRGEE